MSWPRSMRRRRNAPRNRNSPLQKHWRMLKVSDDDLAEECFPEYAAVGEQVRKAITERDKDRPRLFDRLSVFVETDPQPPVHHLLLRGQHHMPGPEVQPGVPAVLSAACRAEGLHDQQADHARADNDRRIAQGYSGSGGGVQGDGQWFDQRGVDEVHFGRQAVEHVLRNGDELGKGPMAAILVAGDPQHAAVVA